MMPLALFRSSDFVGLSILTLLLYGALGGLFVLVPYVLIQGAGFSGTAAGAALLSNLSMERGSVVHWDPEAMKLI